MMKTLAFLQLGAVALANSVSGLSANDLAAMTPSQVSELLKNAGLDSVFGERFAKPQLDGKDLLSASPRDLKEAFPDVPRLYWNRLFRLLEPAWSDATAAAAEMSPDGTIVDKDDAEKLRRHLQSKSMSQKEYSGLTIDSQDALIRMGNDTAIFRTDEGLTVFAGEVNVTNDIRVNGAIVNTEFEDMADNVDLLLETVADAVDDVDQLQADSAALFGAVESATGESTLGASPSNPARSCRHVLQMGGAAHNGHYWITRDGDENAFMAYCDMSRGGLELIFKLNNAGGSNGLTMWKDTSLAYNATVDNNPYKSPNHFVSPYLQATWDSAGDKFNTVYTSMLIGGREEAYATFATNSTTYLDFFSQANLLDSSWTDLRDATPNYFSIEGHADASRYWYMNAAYGGCEVDNGWWVVGGRSSGCDWEVFDSPALLFSPYGTKAAADGGIDGWQMADTFTVFADYDRVYKSCEDALFQSNYRARDGQYWINHEGTTQNSLVYCDMENGGYELVFKLVSAGVVSAQVLGNDAGASGGYYQGCALWTDATRDYPPQLARNVDVHDETGEFGAGQHYLGQWRHRAFSDSRISVDNIEVRVITDEAVKKYLHFSGVNEAAYNGWFGLDYLRTASWTDMFNAANYNYFSIAGHSDIDRCWFANSQYGGCSVDGGWLVVAGRDANACAWEEKFTYPDVMYSTGTTESTADSYALADMLAVFYKWSPAA